MNAATIIGADALTKEESEGFLHSVGSTVADLLAKVNWVALGSGIFWGAMTYVGGWLSVIFIMEGGGIGIALAIVYGAMTLWFGSLSVIGFCNVLNPKRDLDSLLGF